VQVFTLKKGMNDTIIYNETAVRDRFLFDPDQLADYKGLRGDPSDNIIGVPGIGEKTATELILKFKNIENLYKQLHKDKALLSNEGIKDRIIGLLEEYEESAMFSKTLATIRRDAPITFTLPQQRWQDGCDLEKIETMLRGYEFKSLLPRVKGLITGEEVTTKKQSSSSNEVCSREAQIALWLLDSEKTNTQADDILDYTKSTSLEIAEKKLRELITQNNLDFVFQHIEIPLIPVLDAMQTRGVLVDKDFLKTYSEELHEKLKTYEAKIYAHVGHEFNINSPKQLGEIIFGEMQLHLNIKGFKIKKTATGTYSTRESDLEKLIEVHPIIADIFEYRELQKLLSTYIDNIPELLDQENRLHPELLQTGTTTGRFASQNPNIQNIPIRGDQGKKIRNAFIAPEGFSIIAADYSQIELRSAAILSGDQVLLETFRNNKDIHASVAAKVFHVPEHEVTADMRRKAKVINFGILFGMGVTALQKNLGTTRKEAQEFYDEYFKQMTGLSAYIEQTITQAKKTGYTETLFGRRRYFPGLRSTIPFIKAMADRAASNAPIQGTTADIIKLAMILVAQTIQERGWSDKVFMTMQIHDELVFEAHDSILMDVVRMIQETMESVLATVPQEIENKIPLLVSVGTGHSWGEAK
jgi:DNA polymerase-1